MTTQFISMLMRVFCTRTRNRPARSQMGRTFAPRGESLEPRRVLSAVVMSEQDQLLLELVNRSRMDPLGEVARFPELSDLNSGLSGGTIAPEPKQPLAPHQALVDAAVAHAQDMLDNDYFAHNNLAGETPSDRAAAAGYTAPVGENIAWGGSTGPIDQDAAVYDRHKSLFLSPGHRQNMLLETYREVGTGVRFGVFTTSPPDTHTVIDWNASMVAEEFGSRGGDVFITGVAFSDTVVDDDFYTIGESSPGIQISVVHALTGETRTTTTGPSGGYTLQVPDGTYTVTASGGSLPGPMVFTNVAVSAANVKIDFDTSQAVASAFDLVGRAGDGTWWLAQSENGTMSTSTSNRGKWSTSVVWEDTLRLDFNGDGLGDIAGRANGQWWVAQSSGDSYFITKYLGTWSSTTVWSDVQAGDFNGDGLDDVVGRAADGTWWVASSDGNKVITAHWGRWAPINWSDVLVADVNGDGFDDVVGRAQDGTWWTAKSNGQAFRNEYWGRWSPAVTWHDVQVADVNGDGQQDIVGRASIDGSWWVGLSNGSRFISQYWGRWSTTITWQDVLVADVNGDGADDLAGRAADGSWWVARADSWRFVIEYWGSWSASVDWQDVQVADVDGDGNDDIVGRANDEWWSADSTGIRFSNRYLGTDWSTAQSWQYVAAGVFV